MISREGRIILNLSLIAIAILLLVIAAFRQQTGEMIYWTGFLALGIFLLVVTARRRSLPTELTVTLLRQIAVKAAVAAFALLVLAVATLVIALRLPHPAAGVVLAACFLVAGGLAGMSVVRAIPVIRRGDVPARWREGYAEAARRRNAR